MHTHTHTPLAYQGNEIEEKEKGFQGRFKRADRGRMADRNRFPKEFISLAPFPHAWVVSSLTNSYYSLVFIFKSENPLFYQQCNARDVENSKLIGHR